jgi:ParB family chromosome partitioning protein
MLEMAIVENLQRVNLAALEQAQAFQRLLTEFNYSQDELAARLGKSRQYIQSSVALLKLPDPIKDGLNRGLITEGHARAISSAGNDKDMIEVYRTVIAESASVRRAEALSRFRRQQQQNQQPHTPQKLPPLVDVDAYVQRWETNWSKKLVSQASVALTDSRKGTRITITLKGDPTSRQKDLAKILKIAVK